jgi:hypothetical protein
MSAAARAAYLIEGMDDVDTILGSSKSQDRGRLLGLVIRVTNLLMKKNSSLFVVFRWGGRDGREYRASKLR